MIKKPRFLFLIVAIMLVATACGSGDVADTTTTTAAETTTAADGAPSSECFMPVEDGATIVFSGWGDETEQQIYRDSIVRFNEACPDVIVDFQPIPADFQTLSLIHI